MADVAYIPGEPGRERRPAIGYAMVIAAALLFAVNGTVSKVVLQSGISSLELTQVRATGAFLGIALLLEYIGPLLIAIWAWAVFKERVRRRIWAALVLALLGLSLVVEVWTGLSLDGLGVAAALCAAVA